MVPGETVAWRELRIEWNNCPPEVRSATECHVVGALHVLPSWVTEVNFFWRDGNETDNGDAALSVTVRDEYRFLSVFVHPAFLTYDKQGRHLLVLHEFSHVLLKPLDALVENMIRELPEALHGFVGGQLRRAKEAVTQDIADAFARNRPWKEAHAEA
jgi:hypothetical protein